MKPNGSSGWVLGGGCTPSPPAIESGERCKLPSGSGKSPADYSCFKAISR